MITETKKIPKSFLDFDNDPFVWDKVDKLLAEVDETKTISAFFDAVENFVKRLKERIIKKKIINDKMLIKLDINGFNNADELIDHIFSE